MNPMKWFRLNIKIISVLNSCDRKQFEALIDEVISQPKVFYSKRYVWNIIRGRDFYKMLAHYVVEKISDPEKRSYDDVQRILQMVEDTEKNEAVRRNFVWAIMKQVALLTTVTIKYANEEKIKSILSSNKIIYADDSIKPFIAEIKRLHIQIDELEEQIEAMKLLTE